MNRNTVFFPRHALAVAIALASAGTAHAQDAQTLASVVVTGTRTQEGPGTLAASTVITREDIDRLQPSSLPELLRGQPGIAIYNQGGAGKLSAVSLRGTGSGQFVLLVDGVKVGSVSAGIPALQDIPVAQIERIEIVRGPMSSLYGSEAMGGVIQVFTRRANSPFDPHVGVAFGTHDTLRADAGVAGRKGRGWYSANVAYENTHGFNACNGDPVTFAGCGAIEPDRDGYRNRSGMLSAGYDFSDAWSADARVLRSEGSNDFDGYFNHSNVVQQVSGAHVRFAPSKRLALDLNAGRNVDASDNFHDSTFMGHILTLRDQASLKADVAAPGGVASLGYDWERDRLSSETVFDRTRRTTHAVFGQWLGDFGRNHVQLGARREDNSQFGGANTGNAAWGVDLAKALRITASYGSAFRAPTFNDLYYPGFSNPDLRPERSRSAELALAGTHGWGHWSINAYETRLRDLIVFNPMRSTVASPWGSPDNIEHARIRGVETTLGTTVMGWDVDGTASWLDPRNTTPGPQDGNLLNRRAQRIARIDADRRYGQFRVGATVNGSSHRFDDPANRVRLGGYATTDVRVAWIPDPAWTLQLTVSNLFDKHYETAAWYNQPDRALMFSVRWQPAH